MAVNWFPPCGQQRPHRPHRILTGPIYFADHGVSHPPIRADEEAAGKHAHAPGSRRFLIRIQQDREIEALARQEVADARR